MGKTLNGRGPLFDQFGTEILTFKNKQLFKKFLKWDLRTRFKAIVRMNNKCIDRIIWNMPKKEQQLDILNTAYYVATLFFHRIPLELLRKF